MASFVSLTPWAREALQADEIAAIHARTAVLGAYVSVTASKPAGPFQVHVSDRAVRVSRYQVTDLDEGINDALDEFREKRYAVMADIAALGLEPMGGWEPRS